MVKTFYKFLLLVVLVASFQLGASAQQTVITGVVTDLNSGAPIPFATIVFKGGRGTVTDSAGKYKLAGTNQIGSIKISYVGYKTITKNIQIGKTQVINIIMEVDPLLSNNVTVSTNKRAPYKNKNNPAVDLIKRVIQNLADVRCCFFFCRCSTSFSTMSMLMPTLCFRGLIMLPALLSSSG